MTKHEILKVLVRFRDTPLDMIVDHADCLHPRIDDGRPDEAHPSFLEVFRDREGNIGLSWNFTESFWVIDTSFIISIFPKVRIETSLCTDNLSCYFRIFSDRIYFQSVSDDTRIKEDFFEFIVTHVCDPLDIPLMKVFPIVLTFSKDGNP